MIVRYAIYETRLGDMQGFQEIPESKALRYGNRLKQLAACLINTEEDSLKRNRRYKIIIYIGRFFEEFSFALEPQSSYTLEWLGE